MSVEKKQKAIDDFHFAGSLSHNKLSSRGSIVKREEMLVTTAEERVLDAREIQDHSGVSSLM